MTRIEEIRARLEAATPGPWEVTQEGSSVISAACNICGTYHNHTMHDGGRTWDAQPDADFIAHSRVDVPFLLDLVAELTAERDAERSLREKYQLKLAFRSGDLTALRAVVEEAREELDLIYDSGAMQVGANLKIIEILDRGLKGAGDE